MEHLQGKKVAILVADGFEQVELTEPRKALDEAGAKTQIVSPSQGKVKGWNHTEWGDELPVDLPLARARADEFDALLLPGGVMNPDHLRRNPEAQRFVKAFSNAGKPVAAEVEDEPVLGGTVGPGAQVLQGGHRVGGGAPPPPLQRPLARRGQGARQGGRRQRRRRTRRFASARS